MLVHEGGHTLTQVVHTIERGEVGWGRPEAALDVGTGLGSLAYRERLTKQVEALFGAGDSAVHKTHRPNALLSPDQLWNVFVECGDVRSAVETIARKVSTQAHDFKPIVEPDDPLYEAALEQQRAARRFFLAPGTGETWQTFWFKIAVDALVFFHGALENVFSQVPTISTEDGSPRIVGVEQGLFEEFAAVHSPTIYVVQNKDTGEVEGYLQTTQGYGSARRPRRKGLRAADVEERAHGAQTILLPPSAITRLVLAPNTRSPYSVPPIETVVKQVSTLMRADDRAMLEMDVGEVPPGYLILTGSGKHQVQEIKQGARNFRGRDNKLRVIHTPGATSPAHWLRLSRSYKELEYQPIIHEAKQIIRRVFGVSPVSQGDTTDANRSDSDAMLKVDEDGLFGPTLAMVESLMNMQMLPLWLEKFLGVTDGELLIAFEFNRKRQLTPEEDKTQAEADDVRLGNGTRTINEVRKRDGLPPFDGGDEPRIDGVPLTGLNREPDSDGGGAPPSADGPQGDEEAPGEGRMFPAMEAWLLAMERAREDDLPSAWTSPGAYDGLRTVDLPGLWDSVIGYKRAVAPLYADARREVLATTGAAARGGSLGNSEHLRRVGESLSALRERWSAEVRTRYDIVAEGSAAAARKHSGNDRVGSQAGAQAIAYHETAMAFLDQLISDLRTRVFANINAVAIGRVKTTAEGGLGPDSDDGELLEAVERSFNANEHRITNWSGRLVELASLVFAGAMQEAPPIEDATDPGVTTAPSGGGAGNPTGGGEWVVQWSSPRDTETCDTCDREAGLGLRPASTLTVWPGGSTECRANCRCVLIYWTAKEVADGTARLVNP